MFHHLFGSAGRNSPEELNRDRLTLADILEGLRRSQEETTRNQSALFHHQGAQDQVLKNIVDQQERVLKNIVDQQERVLKNIVDQQAGQERIIKNIVDQQVGHEQILQNLVQQQNQMFSEFREETRTLRSDWDKMMLEVDKIGRIGRRQPGGGRNERVVPDGVPPTCYYVARSPDGRANCPAGCGSNYSRGYLYKHLQSCGSREGNGPVRIISKPVNIPDGDGNGVPDIAGI